MRFLCSKYGPVTESGNLFSGSYQLPHRLLSDCLGATSLWRRIHKTDLITSHRQATIEGERLSQTGGLPTDPTTKKQELGTISRVGESVRNFWRLRMMLSAWHVSWKCSRGQRLNDLVTGCRVLPARNDHLNRALSGRNGRGSPAQGPPDTTCAALIKTTE